MYNVSVQFQRAIPDDCTCSMTEQNIAINDLNDAMIISIGHYRYKSTSHPKLLAGVLTHSSGIILIWPSLKIVQMVLRHTG